jgi:translation initiation factor 3 subunit L
MTRQAEKTLLLLGIALVFYPVNIDENVMANLREKFGDKLEKLQKYDLSTFQDTFTHGCPKFIVPIKDLEHFKNFGYDLDITDIVNKQRDLLSQEFSKIQQLNNMTGVLKLYDTIKLDKLAKILNVSVADMTNLIQLYQDRNRPPTKDVPFEQTIVKKILESVKSLDFTNENGVLKVNDVSTKPNFNKIFYRNIHKLEEITHDIKNL